MMRRYQSSSSRFNQPDPYDGSYDFTDPQSLNRYAYVQNDPVNFVDPSGLNAAASGWNCSFVGSAWLEGWGTLSLYECRYEEGIGGGGGGGFSGGFRRSGPQNPQPVDPCNPATLVPLDPGVQYRLGPRARDLFSPQFAQQFSAALRELNARGIVPIIPSAYRTAADQRRMVQGGSGPLPAASVGLSRHQSGNAVDISTRTPQFATVVSVMQRHGFIWGGNWRSVDPPHFELNPFGVPRTSAFRQAARAASATAESYFNQCVVQIP